MFSQNVKKKTISSDETQILKFKLTMWEFAAFLCFKLN